MEKRKRIWKDRKRNFLGLPWTFTKYELDDGRLFITTGFFTTKEDEVRLYRITDISLRRSFWQKITGTGTIHCDSSDHTMGNFDIINIKHSRDVKEQLSELVEKARRDAKVYTGENLRGGIPAGAMEHPEPGPDGRHEDRPGDRP